MKFHDTLSINQ